MQIHLAWYGTDVTAAACSVANTAAKKKKLRINDKY